jgi:ribosomal protein L11 methyltransferase
LTGRPPQALIAAVGPVPGREASVTIEGWLWDVRRRAAERAAEAKTATWRLSFAVPRPLLPPFEAALAGDASAILTTEIPPGTLWRVEALFAGAPSLDDWQVRLGAVAAAAGMLAPQLELAPLPDVDWVAESLKQLPPVKAGRFFVHGRHDAHRMPAGAIALRLEAGRAFGTGQHETTRGCLIAIDRLARAGRRRRIADLGTGSGILAFAAAKIWHAPVLGGDVDEEAVATARANARELGLRRRVRFVRAAGLQHRAFRAAAPYDLVLANILAGPLMELAGPIGRALSPGGVAVLSGLLARQERQVLAPCRSVGLMLASRIAIGDWPTLILCKP